MRSQLTLLVILLGLFVAVVMPACYDDNDEPPGAVVEEFRPECSASRKCAEGLNCQWGICVDGPSGEQFSVSLHIVPPAQRGDLSPLTFRQMPLESGTSYGTWSLQPQRSIFGQVMLGNSREGVRALIYFTGRDGISTARHVLSTATSEDGSFTAALPEGAYDIAVLTDRPDIPEYHTTIDVLPVAAPLNITLPDATEYIRWSGRLVRLDDNQVTRPITNVRIWAVASDGSGQSTSATTDQEGVFSVWLHRDVLEFRFQIRGGTTQDADSGNELMLPTSTFAPIIIEEGWFPTEPHQWIPGEMLVMNRLDSPITLSGVVRNTAGEPVPDAHLLATARLDEPSSISGLSVERATFTARASTDASGRFTLLLQPSLDYQITAASWLDGVHLSAARTTKGLLNGEPITNFDITMEPLLPREVEIVVNPAFRTPVAVEIVAEMVSTPTAALRDYDIAQDLLTSVNALSDVKSPAQVPLMAGTWWLRFAATSHAAIPTTSVLLEVDRENKPLRFVFPQGIVVAGTVNDERGNPLPGATVEVWLEREDGSATYLGRGSSYRDGEVRAVISWPLTSHAR